MCRMERCEGRCKREDRIRPGSCRKRNFAPLTLTTPMRSEAHHLAIQPAAATIEIKSTTAVERDVASDERLAA